MEQVVYTFTQGTPEARCPKRLFKCPHCREENCVLPRQSTGDYVKLVGGDDYYRYTVKCIYNGCQEHGSMSIMANHILQCPRKPLSYLKCEYCQESVAFSNMKCHVQFDCSSLPCETCNCRIPSQHYAAHLKKHQKELDLIGAMRQSLDELATNMFVRGRTNFFENIHEYINASVSEALALEVAEAESNALLNTVNRNDDISDNDDDIDVDNDDNQSGNDSNYSDSDYEELH